MGIHNREKLNELLGSWPRGTVAVYPFFQKLKISPQLVAKYVKGGWVKKIAAGAYRRFDDDKAEWYGGLYTIQKVLKLPVHIGGPKALELSGYAQNLSLKDKGAVWLFGKRTAELPRWFSKTDWDVQMRYQTSNLFSCGKDRGIVEREVNGLQLRVSTPERAILETLDFVPQEISFEYAGNVVEVLQTLRPKLVEELLIVCRSVKVKRLFLFLAEYNKLPWLDDISRKKICLGKGSRSIAKPGVLDAKYQITVPASFKVSDEK
jgi:hypothetical protein